MRIDPVLTDEVRDALDRGLPVVALETTLVSHGFPGGEGVQVALTSEEREPSLRLYLLVVAALRALAAKFGGRFAPDAGWENFK